LTVIETQQVTAPAKQGDDNRGYRPDQGRLARKAAFWSLALILLFGCTFLHDMLFLFDSMSNTIGDFMIPVVAVDLTTAFLISAGVFMVGFIVLDRWRRRPAVADLLIDTEAELRKVAWPTGQEVVNSSLVVIFTVVATGGFLALADYLLARIMQYLILGEVG
jgi:preprotein translocase SecE subunit